MSNINKKKIPKNVLIFLGIPVLVILAISIIGSLVSQKNYNYSEIVNRFKRHEVIEYSMNLGSGDMDIKLKDGNVIHYTAPSVNLMYVDIKEHIESYNKQNPDAPMVYNLTKAAETSWIMNALTFVVLPMLMFGLMLWFIMKKITVIGGDAGKSFSFGKAKTKEANEKNKVRFDCVAGAEEEKEELAEIVDFLKIPKKYNALGARIPKGVLLIGPPGTGKTLLAKAVAGEAGVPFYPMSGSDFVEMFVGVGASRVRDLFNQAKKTVPCVIFIDEIDAVGRQRGAGLGGGHDEREQTLNQLLVEMDGFGTNEGIIVLGATNRSDILDPALVRKGRFDRNVFVGYPDVKGREDILRIHAKGKSFNSDVSLTNVARSTAGFTGADLENLLNEAALAAAKKNQTVITNVEVEEATVRVIVGTEKKSKVITEEEKKLTAYHESGHALVMHYCDTQDEVHQISIIPRGPAGGYTLSLPEKNYLYTSKKKMKENITALLGGRAAEVLAFDEVSTGASNDIEQATKLARYMTTRYGMSEELGPISYADDDDVLIVRRYMKSATYSEEFAAKIDREIKKTIDDCYMSAEKILKKNIDLLHKIAKYLIFKEKISGDEFRDIIAQSAGTC